jgi:hypothetical protein
VDVNLNTADTEMGAEQGAEAQQAPQTRDTMQRQNLNTDHLKSTDGSPPIKTQMGVISCSLPKMQIGANNTEKTPDDSDDSE